MQYEMPIAFKKACRNLGQDIVANSDIALALDPMARIAEVALTGIELSDAEKIRDYLSQVLKAPLSLSDINDLWHSTPAEVYFHRPDDVMRFLQALYERLSVPPYVAD